MHIYPGDDHTKSDDFPLNELLLNKGVVHLLKTNHPALISSNQLFDNEETLCMFFGKEHDADLI